MKRKLAFYGIVAVMTILTLMMIATIYSLHLDIEQLHNDNIQQKAIIEEQMKGIRDDINNDLMNAIYLKIEKIEEEQQLKPEPQNFYEMEGEQL